MNSVVSRPQQIAQTLDRGLQVLEAVSRSGDPVTVAQAAATVGIDRTVAHRLVTTLAARGYLHREAGGGYRLGPTCLALAAAISDLRTVARPWLEQLATATGETVHLVILSGKDVVFIDGVESNRTIRVAMRTGRLLPAHATSVGKAWLAALPPFQVDELYGQSEPMPVTAKTLAGRQALDSELEAIRARGYATSQGESEDGVGSIGVAVLNPAGEPRLAISLAFPLDRWSTELERSGAEALLTTAASLGAQL